MPYKIAKRDGEFCVFKHDASGNTVGDSLGCHATEADAKQQMAALYANEPAAKVFAVKFADGADDLVEGPGMPFGGPFNGQDLYGEHFSLKTDFAFSWFPDDSRPLLYHHALDGDVSLVPVGRVKSYEVKADVGVWTKAQLDKSSEYFGAIKDLVKAGKLFFSSGAMAHLVDVDKKNGEIKRWPWVELSLTPTPANLLATVDLATATKHYKSAGLALPDAARGVGQSTAVASRGQGFYSINNSKAVNEEAFWSHVNKGEGDNAHWLWTGAKNTKGYGILEVDGSTVRAHRVAYEMAHGTIPDDKDVGHKTECATTSCVRASHLELVTNEENAAERANRKAVSMARMKEMAAEMDMEMSEDEMAAMMEGAADMSEADMKKRLAQHKASKSVSLRAEDGEMPAEDQEALDKVAEYIGALTDITDADLADLDKGVLDSLIEMVDELVEGSEAAATKAGGHSGHGGAHASHGGEMGPKAKGAAKKRVLGSLEKKASGVLSDLRNVRKMKLTSPRGESMRREIIKGAQTELAGIRKKIVAARAKYKAAPPLRMASWQQIEQQIRKVLQDRLDCASPFEECGYVCIEEAYSDHVIACVWKEGTEHYFSVPFALDADGQVTNVGQPEEVEETYIPKKPEQPVALMAWVASRYAASLAERTKDLSQRRLKEGRVISGMNRKRLEQCLEAMGGAMKELQGLLDSSAPQPAKAAALRRQADFHHLTLWAAANARPELRG